MPLGNTKFNVGEIITAAAQELRDNEFGRLGRPFYLSAAQRGLQEMNSATNFYKKVFETPVPDNLVLELPNDLTETDGIYLVKGSGVNFDSSTILFVKPNMWHKGGEGYIANNKGRNRDDMQFSLTWSEHPPAHIYFAGLRDGKLYLSPSCRQWDSIYIMYTGLGVDCFGEDFEIPHWCREAITDFVIHRAALAMEMENPNFYGRVIARKESEMKAPNGSWWTAVGRYKRLDKKGRYDTTAYTFRIGHTP
ncbi:MAG: hypothetical protein ACK54F_03360 [Planctomycetia bacterium]